MLINGRETDLISVFDRGLQYGDGLFETIAVVEETPCLWQRHMDRLRAGCERLSIPMPDQRQLLEEAREEIDSVDRCILKIVVTRGVGGRGYLPPTAPQPSRLIGCFPWPDFPEGVQQTGASVRICSMRLSENPELAGIKHLNRLDQVLARGEWSDSSVAEGIMMDSAGRIIEGTKTNFFLISGGHIYTPPLERCGVAGVMRGLILELATEWGLPISVREIGRDDLHRADGAFLSNSLIGIWPIKELSGRLLSLEAVPRSLIESVMERGFRF